MRWQPGQQIGDHFRVKKILGFGNMGEVYHVVRETPNQDYEFAAKILSHRRGTDEHRRIFLKELQTWMELPSCPYITECCFYRTIDNRTIIFSEYVEGGTLKEWIADNRISSLAHILEISIECALGLEVSHNIGVIHQDIKSANVLMTIDGHAKITDFGISGLKPSPDPSQKEIENIQSMHETVLVTSRGLTPAYCSPEQAEKQKVGRGTDIWSLAIVIFEMFAGKVNWELGILIPEILMEYMQNPTGRPIPNTLFKILTQCLETDPSDRCSSMNELAQRLAEVYRIETGKEYPIPETGFHARGEGEQQRIRRGAQWMDPQNWLKRAYGYTQTEPSEDNMIDLTDTDSGVFRLLSYLSIYNTVDEQYTSLIKQGRADLRVEHACLLYEKALAHSSTEDRVGAIECLDRMVDYMETVNKETPDDIIAMSHWGVALMERANLVQFSDAAKACEEFDQAINLLEKVIKKTDRILAWENLCRVYHNAAKANLRLNRNTKSLKLMDLAMKTADKIVSLTGNPLNMDLANVLCEKGTLIAGSQPEQAEEDFLKALEIVTAVDLKQEAHDVILVRIDLYESYGQLLHDQKRYDEALDMFEKALEIVEPLIDQEGWRDMLEEQSRINLKIASCYYDMSRYAESETAIHRSIPALEKVIYRYGLFRGTEKLAEAYDLQAKLLIGKSRFTEATLSLESGIALLTSEIDDRKHIHLIGLRDELLKTQKSILSMQ